MAFSKPGIVANKAGARLSFEVDTSGATNPAVSLQHLESKTGMGIALLECAHCKCKATRIDATGAVSRLSTLVTREVSVSSHKQCKLSLTVLNETSGGEGAYKFKLARLFVTGDEADGVSSLSASVSMASRTSP